MGNEITNANLNSRFSAMHVSSRGENKSVPKPIPDDNRILPNTPKTQLLRGYHKITNAFTEYPAKGLTGDKKATFYEFLQMGTVPYILGSLTFMGLFNGLRGKFPNFNNKGAANLGNKMALGVLFYGLASSISKSFVSKPVKWATGIDTEMPYQRTSYRVPESANDTNLTQIEQHKVFESCDFPRFDLLYNKDPEKRNEYYDKIAKKNGLGKNLEASDAEVKPLIRDVISRSSTAKSLSSYIWGAAGVALATQPSWTNFFNALSKNSWVKFKPLPDKSKLINATDKAINIGSNLWRITKSFGRNFVKATKELYHGPEAATGFSKHAGKLLLATAIGMSVFGTVNTILGAKSSSERKFVIDDKKKVTVD